MRKLYQVWMPIFLVCLVAATANAQSFRVQCPTTTTLHKTPATSANPVGGSIKCQQISVATVSPPWPMVRRPTSSPSGPCPA